MWKLQTGTVKQKRPGAETATKREKKSKKKHKKRKKRINSIAGVVVNEDQSSSSTSSGEESNWLGDPKAEEEAVKEHLE